MLLNVFQPSAVLYAERLSDETLRTQLAFISTNACSVQAGGITAPIIIDVKLGLRLKVCLPIDSNCVQAEASNVVNLSSWAKAPLYIENISLDIYFNLDPFSKDIVVKLEHPENIGL